MNTYRIRMSDRQRTRTITETDARYAIAVACGSRFYSAYHDCDSLRPDGSIEYSIYAVNVQTGPTRGGCTPVRQVSAFVEFVRPSVSRA